MDTRDYGERSRAYKRMINGEFDMNFGDWDIHNPNKKAIFSIDHTSKISGVNSAEIENIESGSEASLIWTFPNGDDKQYEVTFNSIATCNAKLQVSFEPIGKKGGSSEIEFVVKRQTEKYSFQTKKIMQPGRFRLVFDLSQVPVNENIWLDKIQLTAVDH